MGIYAMKMLRFCQNIFSRKKTYIYLGWKFAIFWTLSEWWMLFCLLFFLSCHDWLFQNHFDLFSLYANAMIFNCICIQITSPGGTPIRGKPARYRHAHLSWLPLLHSLPPLPFLYLCVSITSRLSSVHATDSVCANSLHKVMYGLGGTHTHSFTHTHTRDCVKKKNILIIIFKKKSSEQLFFELLQLLREVELKQISS